MRYLVSVIILTLSGFCHADVKLEQIRDGLWEVQEEIVYRANSGEVYVVPAGFVTDLASVPRAAQWYVKRDDIVLASIVHDKLYRDIHQIKDVDAELYEYYRKKADKVMLEIMRKQKGLGRIKRKLIYTAVRKFGGK